ncbi:TIGR02186 family protein [Psychromarinibacter halotolerans]|uniref:TIGR02186 family protein n=1 Tax=Psychromarinibacter halotolerans TaxID=1775175 RepID=A0ABV7GR41_9RHOB|nr:TIGR02186 family protein [Psychromarinibacter halotolerans]MDF0595526.1 TIGR02186 family protein [Psychromarinibacter halotolerans]
MRVALLLLLLLVPVLTPSARADETVVAGMSQNRVSITASFEGSEILIFGAVKRFQPVPDDAPPLEVLVAVAGPSVPLTVWRKERVAGIWVNTDAVEVDRAPSFYAVATSGPFYDVLSNVEDLRHKVSLGRAIRSVGAPATVADASQFTAALMRIRERSDLYQLHEGTVEVSEETLFRTSIGLPANLHEGNYTARIFLTRGGNVLDAYETVIYVQKVGLERWLYVLAQNHALLYGLLSIALAIASGWLASAVFRYIRS